MQNFSDGLINALTGSGSTVDKRFSYVHSMPTQLDPAQIDAAYRDDWIARKVIDVPVSDMTRGGLDIQLETDEITRFDKANKRLGLYPKIKRALTLGRLGGGVMLLGLPGSADLEAKPAPLSYLHVMSAHRAPIGPIIRDISSPYYGQPAYYTIMGQSGAVNVHPSRVIPFKGLPVSDLYENGDDRQVFWGDSALQPCINAINNATIAQNEIAALIAEAKVDVFSISRLADMLLGEDGDAVVRKRFQAVANAKSIHRAVVQDAEDKWEQRQITWAGMPDVLKAYLSIVAGASNIPATRLLGKSADGMNATGEGDLQDYWQFIQGLQSDYLDPALDRILPCIQAEIATGEISYSYPPLQVPSESELATIAKQKAETSKIYHDMAVLPESEFSQAIANQLIEDGTYPGLDQSIKDLPDNWAEQIIAENEAREAEIAAQEAANAQAKFGDMAPRSLYVSRRLINTDEFTAWAKSQGFENVNDDLHVTVLYSRQPVDWMAMGDNWSDNGEGGITIPPGGPRIVERLGEDAIALSFASSHLSWRHMDMVRNGASHDWPEYQPHVTVTNSGDVDLSKVEPFQGALKFGPEVFEEIKE